MDSIKGYILSIVGVAIVCAVAKSLINKNTATGQTISLLCGILMAITIAAPLVNVSFQNLTGYWDEITASGNVYTEEGKTSAEDSMSGIIKEQTEAYILDKANRMGLQIAVEVELDADNNTFPCGVTISGAVSPYSREVMSAYIEENLGIAKEHQEWT